MSESVKSVILDVRLDQGQSIQDAAALRDTIAQLNQELKNNKRDTQEQKDAYEVTKASIKSLTLELNRNTTQLANQQTAVKANNGSFNQLYNSLKVGEAQLKALTGTIQKNADGTFNLTKEYFDAKKEVDNAKNALLLFNAGIAQGNLNVGNYDNTLNGLRQKLADLQVVIQNTDVTDLKFEQAKNEAAELSTQIQIAEGKIDSMGEKVAKNKIKDGFNDALGATQALSGGLNILALTMGNDTEASEQLRKVIMGVTIAQTALTIAKSKDDVIGAISIVTTKAQTAAQKLYTLAVGESTGALKVLRIALAATGIGLAIVGIIALVSAIKSWTGSTDDQTESQEELNKKLEEYNKQVEIQFQKQQRLRFSQINDLRREIELMEAKGASDKAIHDKKVEMLNKEIYLEMVHKNSFKETDQEYQDALQKQLDLQNELAIENENYKNQVIENSKKLAKEEVERQKDLIEKNKDQFDQYISDLTEKYKGLNVEYAKLRDEDYEDLKEYLFNLTQAEGGQRFQSEKDADEAARLRREKQQEDYDARIAAYQDHLQEMGEFAQEFGDKVGQIFGESLTETGLDLQKFSKGVTLLILDSLKKTVQASIAEITAKQIAEKGFIGIITGGLLSAAVSAAFATAKAAIENSDTKFFYEGGYTGEGNPREESSKIGKRSYVYHKDEYVVPSKVLNDPQGSELVAKLEKMRVNNPFNFNLFGKADGGFAKNFSSSILNQSGLSARDLQQIKLFVSVHEINNAQNNVRVTESLSQL